MKYPLTFFGTTEGSRLLLEKLLTLKNISVDLIVTKKGKPAGRGMEVTLSPVARFSKERSLPYIEVERTVESLDTLKKNLSEIFFVVDFGKIIQSEVLSLPRLGALNLHLSYLPQYRGGSPIVAPILNGDAKTGFSYMLLDREMDHGPVLYQEKVMIQHDDTAETLEKKLFEKGVEKLEYVLNRYLSGELKPVEQDHSKATITKLINKEDALIDFEKETAETIERKIRAYNPAPYVFFFHEGKRIQIIKALVTKSLGDGNQRFAKSPEGIIARCAKGTFLLLEIIKPEGKSTRSSKEFEQYFWS